MRSPSRPPGKPRVLRSLMMTAGLFLFGTAHAVEPGVDFALALARSEQRWALDGTGVDTVARRVGVSFYEETAQRPELGLLAGRVLITTSGQALTAGMTLDGYYAGLALRRRWTPARSLGAALEARYVYHNADDRTAAQRVSVDWQGYGVFLDARLNLSAPLQLLLGGSYEGMEGNQRARGAVNQSLDIRVDSTWGARAGVALEAGGGEVRVMVSHGLNDAVEISFQRSF